MLRRRFKSELKVGQKTKSINLRDSVNECIKKYETGNKKE